MKLRNTRKKNWNGGDVTWLSKVDYAHNSIVDASKDISLRVVAAKWLRNN